LGVAAPDYILLSFSLDSKKQLRFELSDITIQSQVVPLSASDQDPYQLLQSSSALPLSRNPCTE
jgi:hypothetical protein